jgi:hypothetical protein
MMVRYSLWYIVINTQIVAVLVILRVVEGGSVVRCMLSGLLYSVDYRSMVFSRDSDSF